MIQNIHFFNKWSTFGLGCSLTGLLVSIINGWMNIYNGEDIHLEDPIKIECIKTLKVFFRFFSVLGSGDTNV
jgi:hypothetical protein